MEAIAQWALQRGVYIVSDDIYEKLIYDGHPYSTPAQFSDEIKAITITVNETNKAPVLAAIGNKNVDEETELTFNASATEYNTFTRQFPPLLFAPLFGFRQRPLLETPEAKRADIPQPFPLKHG